jgi:hypothetical protein
MTKPPPDLRRIRAALVLEKLSRPLASDVLADGTIAANFRIPLSRPIQLTDDFIVSQSRLFAAFRRALQGKAARLQSEDKSIRTRANVTIRDDGSGLVKVGTKNLHFDCVGLLTTDQLGRKRAFTQLMARHTLARQHREAVEMLISSSNFSDADFLECVGIIGSSPESFLESLAPLARAKKISLGDLLPERPAYWDNFIGAPAEDRVLEELRSHSERLIAGDPKRAIRQLSLAFCAPELVPHDSFASLDANVLVDMLQEATTFEDHVGIVGAFEVCTRNYDRDPRFQAIGTSLLAKLFSNKSELVNRCWCFAAGVVVCAARLRQHTEMRQRPALWRRLVSAAYASLIVRALKSQSIDGESLFRWAMQISGKAYFGASALDRADLPRWLPDWLLPKILVPDAVGRVVAALKLIPDEKVDPEWVSVVSAARAELGDAGQIFMTYPAIGQGQRRPSATLDEMGDVGRFYKTLIEEPTIDNLVSLTPFFYSFGVPIEAIDPTLKVIESLREHRARWTDPMIQAAFQAATYIAVELRASDLANAIAECLIPAETDITNDFSTSEIVMRIVECAAAAEDRDKEMETLARRLERLAFLAHPQNATDLHHTLRILQDLDPGLAPLLGRAVAASRLGQKAV